MATKQGGLGRGLGELFQRTDDDSPLEAPSLGDGSTFQEIKVSSISPNPQQPREIFDEDELRELADSISEVGLLQPIVVRRLNDAHFELIMGERRWRAHQLAGKKTIPAIIRATDDEHMLRDALLENLHRSQLNPLEEAAAYQQLMDDFGCTQDELSRRIKRSRPHISNTMRLLKLSGPVQRRVAAGVLSAGHARALLGVDDPAAQERLAQRIVAENLSVRAVEEIVALGELPVEERRPVAAQRRHDPVADEVSGTLSEQLETRVVVKRNAKGRGKISIDFASDEDLQRILDLLGGISAVD